MVTWHFRRSVRLIKSELTSHPTRKMSKESISFRNNYFLLSTRWTAKKMMITLTASGESFLEITQWRDDSLIRGHRQVNYLSNLTGQRRKISPIETKFSVLASGIQWIELFDCSLAALLLAERKLNRQWNSTFHCATNFLRNDDYDDWPTRQLGIAVHLTLSTSSLHATKDENAKSVNVKIFTRKHDAHHHNTRWRYHLPYNFFQIILHYPFFLKKKFKLQSPPHAICWLYEQPLESLSGNFVVWNLWTVNQ